MLIKDKDILVEDTTTYKSKEDIEKEKKARKVLKQNMFHAWGDAVDSYLRGITGRYLLFSARANRLEFWGFFAVSAIVYFPLYFLGYYIDMPMLPYYYAIVTFIPSVAITARRLHDVNKNAVLYLGSGIIPLLCFFFLGAYAWGVLFLWLLFILYFFNLPSDDDNELYGEGDNDWEYKANQPLIINKFRIYAIVLWCIIIGFSYMQFSIWSVKVQQQGFNEDLIEQAITLARKEGVASESIPQLKQNIATLLKQMNGQMVTQEDLDKKIKYLIDAMKPSIEEDL